MKKQRELDTNNIQEPAQKRIKTDPDKVQQIIKSDDVPGLEYLVENGLSLDNIIGELHALHYAAQEDSVKILNYLIEVLKVDPSLPYRDGSMALQFAVRGEALDASKYLLEVGANIEIKDQEGNTPLLLASFLGWNKGIELLVYGGANIEAQDHQGASSLHLAVTFQQLEMIKLLCDHSANINIQTLKKITPLCQAVHMGNLLICKYLVEKGADVEIKNAMGGNPLSTAAHYGHAEIVDYLIENGAECNIIINPLWSEAIISTIKFGKYLQMLYSQDNLPNLDVALQRLLEELTNQDAWQQFGLATVKSYGLKVGISNLMIEKLKASPLPSNFKEFIIAGLELTIKQANYNLETFETGLLYENGKIPSPVPFNAINGNDEIIAKSLDDSQLKTLINFYNEFPQYQEPGNYIRELAQKDAGNGLQALALLVLQSAYHSEVAELVLKELVSADMRKILSSVLKLREDLNFTPEDILESSIENCQVSITENDIIQTQDYKSTTLGDLNLDTD